MWSKRKTVKDEWQAQFPQITTKNILEVVAKLKEFENQKTGEKG